MVKATIKRKETAWKEVLEVSDEVAKDRCMEVYKEERREVKSYVYKSKKEGNEQFGRMGGEYHAACGPCGTISPNLKGR